MHQLDKGIGRITLNKESKKTYIDSSHFQYLGSKEDLLKLINNSKHEEPHFIIMRSKDELALYSFEAKVPEIEMPDFTFEFKQDENFKFSGFPNIILE